MANPTSAQPTPTATPPPPSLSSAAPALPPTTFVQADPQTFRDVVQKLTGAAAGDAPEKLPVTAPARPAVGPRRPAFKLQDRRPSVRKLEIKLGRATLQSLSPRSTTQSSPHHYFMPQMLSGGGLVPKSPPFPSPVSPLGSDQLFSPVMSEEERAIAEKGFYLHPSPRAATPGGSNPPELLPLFPLTSPRQSKPAEEESSS